MTQGERIEGSYLELFPKDFGEQLETLRARLHDHRARESALAEKRNLMEDIVTWAEKMGDRLDDLSDEGRREVLQLLLDGVSIDRDNNVEITLAVPIDDFAVLVGGGPGGC